MTAWRRIGRTLDQRIDVGTVVASSSISTASIIYLDAKHFRIFKNKHTLYVCMDALTRRPCAWVLLPHAEKREGYDLLLQTLRIEKARIEAVTSDWHHTIRASVARRYPTAVHQRCASHLLQEVFRRICGKRLLTTIYGRKFWKKIRRIALECDDQKTAWKYFLRLRREYPRYAIAWKKYASGIPGIYEWTKRRDLTIPKTSNQIENCMGVLEQRLKSMRTMKNATMLIRIMTAYIRIKYKSPTKR